MVEPINPFGTTMPPVGFEAEAGGEISSLEEGSRKQQKDQLAITKQNKNALYSKAVQQAILQQPTSAVSIQHAPEVSEIDEAAFAEILGEMKEILQKEVNLFGRVLEKSLTESLHKKLKILENRLLKKMILDIFENPPAESEAADDDLET